MTPEEQAILYDYVRMLRAWAGEQARTNNHADALNTTYTAQVAAILASLNDNDLIQDSSGLGGAATLTKAEVVTITSHVQGVLSNYNTSGHRQLWAKAAGAGNLIG